MIFENFQIGIIFLSFFSAVFMAVLWNKRDKKNKEHFGVLMSVFFWSAFLAFFLKLGIDFLKNIEFSLIHTKSFAYFSIAMEEIVKIFALIVGLEIAGKKFDEISDGIIYGVFAVLGFLFFENIFYLLAYWDFQNGIWDFTKFVGQRNIFSFSIHLSTLFFSFFYANAYLKSSKKWDSRPAPWQFLKQIILLGHSCSGSKKCLKGFFIFIFSPFILLINIFRKFQSKLGVMLYGSFFLSIGIHILLDELLSLGEIYSFLGLFISTSLAFILFRRFDKIDL